MRSEVERSFHVFYQLLEGEGALKGKSSSMGNIIISSQRFVDTLLLEGSVGDYEYLNTSRASIDGVDDREEWRLLKTALDVVGFSAAEQLDLFRVVAAILHIGNIEITADRSDQAQIKTPAQAEKACHLLGISIQEFTKAVLRPRVLAGREWVTQARTKQQALDELSALCKTLYERSFGALVDRINRALERPTSSKSTFIGVLDIAGFEIFVCNKSLLSHKLLIGTYRKQTHLNNLPLITLTKSYSSFSITICLFSNKRSTNARILSGTSLTLAWTFSPLLT